MESSIVETATKKSRAEYFKKYKEEHKDKFKQYAKNYYENNKEKCVENNKRYRHKIRQQIEDQKIVIQQLLEKQMSSSIYTRFTI